MLKIPSNQKIGDLTVYQDDTVWTRFCLVPSIPTVRRDDKKHPVFLLAIYHFSDQSREDHPDLPHGGGYMNFDVQFAVEPEKTEAARAELQKWVNKEYATRRSDPTYKNLPEYASTEPPLVELADPLLSGGKVTMHTTQAAALVSGRFAEAPASLVSGSTAVFNIDLTETGASFMKNLMVDPDGLGHIDLTPIQVVYDLKMWARLPPVVITVKGNSERIHTALQTISQTNRDNPCTPYEVETYRENGVNSTTLKETGLVEVHIDKGDASLPENVMAELQKYALDLFDKMIEERFLAPVEEGEEGAGNPLTFRDDLLPANSRRAREGRYMLRQSSETATMNLEIKIDRSQVVEWPLVAQATLETFFSSASKEEIGRHVVEIFPNDFNTLGVTVQAIVNFEQSLVQALEVQLEYSSKDSSGREHMTPAAFTFRTGAMDPKRFDPTVIGGKREYRSRYRIIFDDGTAGDFTTWETSSSRALNIAIADPGRLKLDVSGAGLNWDLLRGIAVRLTYREAPGTPPVAEQTFELSVLNPSRKWEQHLKSGGRGLIETEATYFFKEDKVVKGPVKTLALGDTLYVVPQPQVDLLNVGLLPAGDWSEVAQVAVSLQYDGGEGLVYDKTFRFTKLDEFAEWTVLLRNASLRDFRYKIIVAYKNGGLEDSGWKNATGDQTIPIFVKGIPKLRVNILANLVDFKTTPAVTVALAYGDQRKTISFTEPKALLWETPLLADGTKDYSYEITWFPTDGDPISSGPTRPAGTELFIRKPPTTKTSGKLEIIVRGFAVEYAVTPFVDVTLSIKDGNTEQKKVVTLSQDQKNATWSIDIGDRSQRRCRYSITYNLADGTRKEGVSGESDDPVISITPYRP